LVRDAVYNGPIIDSHVHLFDPTRPQGVPWPKPGDVMYAPSFPDDYARVVRPLGAVGAIAVEASPWRQDNRWLLDVVRQSNFMVGFVGNLLPGTADFTDDLEWLGAEPLFLGIRYGNLWDRNLTEAMQQPAFIADLGRLRQRGRSLDTANPDPALIKCALDLAEKIAVLRIVIDHLPNAAVSPADERDFERSLMELGKHEHVFMKLSAIAQRVGDHVRFDLDYYKAHLDRLWDIFGDDRIIFGSDYPNSEPLGTLPQIFCLAKSYLATKPVKSQAKVLFENSKRAYRWQERTDSQSV
jgi:L-fuconolactonase